MKILLICLCLSLSNVTDCKTFYEKELKPLNIKGKISEKVLLEKYYLFKIQQDDGSQTDMKLLKNSIGREIYWFALKGSIILKKKGACDIHILSSTPNGDYKGRIFNRLCP